MLEKFQLRRQDLVIRARKGREKNKNINQFGAYENGGTW